MRVHSPKPAEWCAWSEFPRSVWRGLLSPAALPPGARLLIVGPEPGPLAEWLTEFSFDVVAACEDTAIIHRGRRDCPRVDFLRIVPGSRFTLPWHSFDAAFVQPLSPHEGSWLSSTARSFTAIVLASLKPGGRLVWWRKRQEQFGHDDACWSRHLGCFPGQLQTNVIAGGLFRATSQSLVVTFDVPDRPLGIQDWRTFTQRGLLTDRRACCAFAESIEDAATFRRAA